MLLCTGGGNGLQLGGNGCDAGDLASVEIKCFSNSWVNLYDKEFYFNVGTANVEDAKAYCINQGGKLFEPKSSEVNMNITNLAKDRGMLDFWIGINDISEEGNFVYASNGSPIIWSNWANFTDNNSNCPGWANSGECSKNPGYMLNNCKKSCDSHRAGVQDCVQIGHGPDYAWDDDDCAKLYPFICERG